MELGGLVLRACLLTYLFTCLPIVGDCSPGFCHTAQVGWLVTTIVVPV